MVILLGQKLRIFIAIAAVAAFSMNAQAADDLISKIESSGKIRVCFAEDNPWQFRNPATNEWEGLVKDMVVEFANDLGVELVDIDSSWKTAIPSVLNGECDLVGANLFANLKRAKLVLFSTAWAKDFSTAIIGKTSNISSYTDLDQKGNTIVVKAGTAVEDFAKRFFKNATVRPFVSDTDATLVAEVATGRADAWWDSYTKSAILLKKNPQFPVRVIDEKPIDGVNVVWAMNSGEYAFQQLVNVWIGRYIESGKMNASFEKWLGIKYVM